MTDELYKAISAECKKLCPEAMMYRNNVPQGFKTSCFMVTVVDTQVQRKPFNSQQIVQSMDISYFPEKGKEERLFECEKIKEEMLRAFDVISADGISFYVTGKNARITDDVLHFFFDVSYREKLVVDVPLMEELTTEITEG